MSMNGKMPPVGVGWTGASGLVYGTRLVEVLLHAGRDVNLVASSAVAQTAPVELERSLTDVLAGLAGQGPGRLRVFGQTEFGSPLASGSSRAGPFVIAPCSMGTAGRLVAGAGETLLLRAADVCLKERRPLILVPREAPMATHHLQNLAALSERGALIIPAAPGFYHRPRTVADLVDFIVQRVCDHLQVAVDLAPRWGESPGDSGNAGGPQGSA